MGKEHQPVAYVVAGPNGAGKTTFAMRFLPEIAGCRNFINADLISQGLSPLDADATEFEAARIFLKRIRACMAQRVSFAFETTLAGAAHMETIKHLRAEGFQVHIYFLWVPSVGLSLSRIAARVSMGGHDVPEVVVRRRFKRGLSNLFTRYLHLVDYCSIYDNSFSVPVLVYEWTPSCDRIVDRDRYHRMMSAVKEDR